MRILWLSFTAAGAGKLVNNTVAGCGWISSLEEGIRQVPGITLGVGFFHDQQQQPFDSDGVRYYPIQKKYGGLSGKIKQRISNDLYDENPAGIKAAITDFKPDLIHIFGTESGMVAALKLTNVPVVIHLQGLVSPYLSVWFPKGMSQATVVRYSPLRAVLFRRGYHAEYSLFKKRAKREDEAIALATHFFGRTDWDKNYIALLKNTFTYIHCEEVLRSFFYDYRWSPPVHAVFRIVTVINPHLYKGLEMILEAAAILKRYAGFPVEWHVVGMNADLEIIPVIEKGVGLQFSDCGVSFRGTKVAAALVDELLASDLFVHPSHIDNSPNSVCEAMLLGMPVIAGNAGGLPSIINDGTDGLLYNSYDAYELAGIIKRAAADPSAMQVLGNHARERSIARHNIDRIVETVTATYRSMISANEANPLSPATQKIT